MIHHLLICMILCFTCNAREREYQTRPPHIGNFAHEITPAYTFAFGQNIYNAGQFVFYPYTEFYAYRDGSYTSLVPSFVYAVNDVFSLYCELPGILKQKSDGCVQRGIGNLVAQLEYAFISHTSEQHSTLATILGNIAFPTNHLSSSYDCIQTTTCTLNTEPTNFFLGGTFSYTSLNIFAYATLGTNWFTKKDGVRIGTSIYYEGGFGHYLTQAFNATLTGIIECNGIYTTKTSCCHERNEDSGGNIFYIGPSLSIASDRWYISGGIQGPVAQRLNGEQSATRLRCSMQLAFVF